MDPVGSIVVFFVFVDSSGNPNDGEEVLSLRISLDRPEGAVLIVSEETMVDVDSAGDLGMVVIGDSLWVLVYLRTGMHVMDSFFQRCRRRG